MNLTEYNFILKARNFKNPINISLFCDISKAVIKTLGIKKDSKAYSLTIRKTKGMGMSFNVVNRLICSIWQKANEDKITVNLNDTLIEKYKQVDGIESSPDNFKEFNSRLVSFPIESLLKEVDLQLFIQDVIESAQDSDLKKKSPYNFKNMPELYDIVINDSSSAYLKPYLNTERDPFELLLSEVLQKPQHQKLIAEYSFYFKKLESAYNNFTDLDISTEDLKKIPEEYNSSNQSYYDYVLSIQNQNIRQAAELIGIIISYSDVAASGKEYWNQEDDKRTIAKAGVRQNNWVENLIKFKQTGNKIQTINAEVIKNALAYVSDPINHWTMLSQKHRNAISQFLFNNPYNEGEFTGQLKSYFSKFNLNPANEKNLTRIICDVLYDEDVNGIWLNYYVDDYGFKNLSKSLKQKYQQLVKQYKVKLEKSEFFDNELYKFEAIKHFQENFDLSSEDFGYNLITALQKETNLRYRNAQSFLNLLLKHYPNDAKKLFTDLYKNIDLDQKSDLNQKINRFSETASSFEQKLIQASGKDKLSHNQDERSIAAYLTLRYPEDFCFYMDTIYKPLCSYLNKKRKSASKKYKHFLRLLEPLKELVESDSELEESIRKKA